MGQAKAKRQFAEQCFSLMAQMGDPRVSHEDQSRALDDLLSRYGQKLFDLEHASLNNQYVYREALVHDDLRVQHGLHAFMDIFLGYAWRGTHPAAQSLTLGVFCSLDLPATDMVASFIDTRPVKTWLSETLGVSAERIDVYPEAVDPALCYQDIANVVLEFYGAKESYQPGQEKKDCLRYSDEKPDAQDYVLLLVTLRLDTAEELDKYVVMAERGVKAKPEDHFDLQYQIGDSVETATVTPISIDMPFSAMRKHAFYYSEQKLHHFVQQLLDSGIAPDELGVSIAVGTFKGPATDMPSGDAVVYADFYKVASGEPLGQRYVCQVDYAAFGMGVALDTLASAGLSEVKLNDVTVIKNGKPQA